MNGHKPLFWCAIIAQVVGAQVFFWDALPDYRELTAGGEVVGTPKDFVVAVFGLVLMQAAYWYARRLQPQVRFRHRVVLGHVLLCVSEVSFFFVSALATVAMFDHWRRSQFILWKVVLMASAIFAFFCYKRQLASVGDTCWSHIPSRLKKQRSNREKPAKPEEIAAAEFLALTLRKFAVQRSEILFGFTRSRGTKQFHQTRLIRIAHWRLAILLNPFGMLSPQIIVNLLHQV
jgi:hypothetical protein